MKVLHPEAGIRKEAGAGRVRFPGSRGARGWEASVFVTDDLPGMEEAIRWTSLRQTDNSVWCTRCGIL
ncbi:MAG: hypothetical protein QXI12_02240 [Candidatus Methanomethyliaceae archaeon]